MKSIPLKPLGDKVIILPTSESDKNLKSKSGIIIPETINKERPEEGTVVAVGPGRVDDHGKLVAMTVKKGQRVIFAKYGPEEIKFDGQNYLIISESQILAIVD